MRKVALYRWWRLNYQSPWGNSPKQFETTCTILIFPVKASTFGFCGLQREDCGWPCSGGVQAPSSSRSWRLGKLGVILMKITRCPHYLAGLILGSLCCPSPKNKRFSSVVLFKCLSTTDLRMAPAVTTILASIFARDEVKEYHAFPWVIARNDKSTDGCPSRARILTTFAVINSM